MPYSCQPNSQTRHSIHIPSRGEEADNYRMRGYCTRRWVVDRTHVWLNRFRRLLIRWEKKITNINPRSTGLVTILPGGTPFYFSDRL